MKKILLVCLVLFSVMSSISFAHDSHASGFVSGFTHPIFGFDHLLAMFSVGVLSTIIGGRAIWVVPLAFVLVMVAGGFLGMEMMDGLPGIEIGIAISVVALGFSIFIGDKLPMFVGIIFVSLFAFFHGFAHGEEMPSSATPALYAFGFVLATTIIHIAGVVVGEVIQKYPKGQIYLKYSGIIISCIGIWLIVSSA